MIDIAAAAPLRPAGPGGADADAEMARHGILRDRDDRYHVDGLSYTRLADALTQVARRARAGRRGS